MSVWIQCWSELLALFAVLRVKVQKNFCQLIVNSQLEIQVLALQKKENSLLKLNELIMNIWLCFCQTIVDFSNCYHLLIMAIGKKKANFKGKLFSHIIFIFVFSQLNQVLKSFACSHCSIRHVQIFYFIFFKRW